ncbi:TPA: molecular chaperone [Escherichia coli]|nr:molecular chaperone [Escherichia coli]HEI3181222.1 molecular chaperone [Escherichia coli]
MLNPIAKYLLSFCFICVCGGGALASTFGPHESKIIFDEKDGGTIYSIDNTDPNKAWLVQSWIEDANGNKTDDFITLPGVIRVEPRSKPVVRVIKKTNPQPDRESLYWIVSHSILAGSGKRDSQTENNARLTLAFRFKVPMFYRPKTLLANPEPEKLEWSVGSNGDIHVNNPTKYAVQLHHVNINGKKHQGDGVSYIILPMTSTTLKIKAEGEVKVQYAIINDYGALKNYTSQIKKNN